MTVIINPGSGPVVGATEGDAYFNMGAFTADLLAEGAAVPDVIRNPQHDAGGRWAFVLKFPTHSVEVEMPGLPLSRVRYLSEPDQDIWDFPRLYVNGSSWIWQYALGVCGPDDDEPSS